MEQDVTVDEAAELVPEIVKLVHAALAHHPLTAGRPLGQIKALSHLYRHGPCSIGEVAQGIGLSMPAASEMIERLVEDGLVERRVNPANRRQAVVELTPAATEFGDRLRALRRAQVQAALARLPEEDRPAFVRSLRALAEALRESVAEMSACSGSGERRGCPPAAGTDSAPIDHARISTTHVRKGSSD